MRRTALKRKESPSGKLQIDNDWNAITIIAGLAIH